MTSPLASASLGKTLMPLVRAASRVQVPLLLLVLGCHRGRVDAAFSGATPTCWPTLAVLAIGTPPAADDRPRGAHLGLVHGPRCCVMALRRPGAGGGRRRRAPSLLDAIRTRPPLLAPGHRPAHLRDVPARRRPASSTLLRAADVDRRRAALRADAWRSSFLVLNLLNFVLDRRADAAAPRRACAPLGADGPRLNVRARCCRGSSRPRSSRRPSPTARRSSASPRSACSCCVLFTFQLLLRAVLEAEHQRDDLARSASPSSSDMHEGLLAAMLKTLSLRDPMTARHSAAVARYARAVAAAAGHERRPSRSSRTPPACVHDIGKASFDDELLTQPRAR